MIRCREQRDNATTGGAEPLTEALAQALAPEYPLKHGEASLSR